MDQRYELYKQQQKQRWQNEYMEFYLRQMQQQQQDLEAYQLRLLQREQQLGQFQLQYPAAGRPELGEIHAAGTTKGSTVSAAASAAI
jgi:hypothetical protein